MIERVPNKLTAYSGLNTGHKAVSALAAEFVERGFVAPDATVTTFTLDEASHNPREAAKAAEDSFVVFHSMGHLGLEDMLVQGILPAAVVSLNRPMPTGMERLIAGGGERFLRHLARSAVGPYAPGHRQIVEDTRLAFVDWNGNMGRIPEVARFSGDERLGEMAAAGVPVVAVISVTHDEFGPAYRQGGTARNVTYTHDVVGCHDGALYTSGQIADLVADSGVLLQLQIPKPGE